MHLHAIEHHARLLCRKADAAFGADQHRHDQAEPRGIHGAAQRVLVAGVHHRAAHGLQALAQRQQLLVARLGVI
ncbi:hypothetical protein SDC9_165678 [bioreactor metagenome]|uniref:Uncharacterized protein n=1 Tax=bioreactor metagenome TaxID=1076179 RepID=A0A645FUX3_9ZZZZ